MQEATLTLMMLLLSTRVWISDKTGSKLHRLLLSGDTPASSLPDGSAAEADSLLSGSMFLFAPPRSLTAGPRRGWRPLPLSRSSPRLPHPRIMTALPFLPLVERTAAQLSSCVWREGGGCPEKKNNKNKQALSHKQGRRLSKYFAHD